VSTEAGQFQFHSVLGLDLGSWPDWKALDGYIAARNIIVHGLGELTGKHRRSPGARDSLEKRLEAADLSLKDGSVDIASEDVSRCARLVQGFVVWLDGENERAIAGSDRSADA